jgi:hypothetical protein
LGNTSSELYLLEKSIPFGSEFAQCNVEFLIAEAGAAKLQTFDGSAAPIACSLFGIWANANNCAIGLAVLAESVRRPPSIGVAIGQTIL